MKAKVERSRFGILTFLVLQAQMLSAAVEPAGDVHVALKHVGYNRSELETALREVKGEDTEYLMSHASQYDLVNLTATPISPPSGPAQRLFQGKRPTEPLL
jgi:hypothetical protein